MTRNNTVMHEIRTTNEFSYPNRLANYLLASWLDPQQLCATATTTITQPCWQFYER